MASADPLNNRDDSRKAARLSPPPMLTSAKLPSASPPSDYLSYDTLPATESPFGRLSNAKPIALDRASAMKFGQALIPAAICSRRDREDQAEIIEGLLRIGEKLHPELPAYIEQELSIPARSFLTSLNNLASAVLPQNGFSLRLSANSKFRVGIEVLLSSLLTFWMLSKNWKVFPG